MSAGTFATYLASLGRLSGHVDPTAPTAESEAIRVATTHLLALPTVHRPALAAWLQEHPDATPVLALVVGLTREKLRNMLRDRFGTAGWITLARSRAGELVGWLDDEFELVRLLGEQRFREYGLADVLIARASTRSAAAAAGRSGRKVEDEIESVAAAMGLPYRTRTRFTGRQGRSAPCDLVVPETGPAEIVVAAKGFDSTGSKLTDAVREIVEMAEIRLPRQFVMAVVDGIGWKSRQADLRRIHQLWANQQIDGLYTLATLDEFADDLEEAARLRGYL